MKRFIVTWWNGEAVVTADCAETAKQIVREGDCNYRTNGHFAPLFVEEVP